MGKQSFFIACLLILASVCRLSGTAVAEGPAWWETARKQAASDGYRLIDPEQMRRMVDSGDAFLLLDVRPGYEYRSGHLPGAAHLEFDLGDRMELKPEKRAALEEILGPDKDRTVVIYCRSFR